LIKNHIVEITPVRNNSGQDQIVDIGMFNGVMRWATAYDDYETSATCSDKFLADKWIGPLTKTATVERIGNYTATGGGVITLVSTARLLKWLKEYKISIYNALVTIKESRDGGVTYYPIRTGIVSETADELKMDRIPFSDTSKSTATTITKEIEDSGKFYPVSFGQLPNAKVVAIEGEKGDALTVGGELAVFSCDGSLWLQF